VSRPYLRPAGSVTPAMLHAEGIVELGRVGSLLYVLTRAKLHLFHALSISEMQSPHVPVPEDLQLVAMEGT
jgi:hypothetical protein